jgi:hypothetical protein
MSDTYYQIYWLSEYGTKTYHTDEAFGTPWRFWSYEDCYSVGQRLTPPSINHKLMFEAIQS